MPNWLKQTLHLISVAAMAIVGLPAAGVSFGPHTAAVQAIAGVVGTVAAKATPGVGQS